MGDLFERRTSSQNGILVSLLGGETQQWWQESEIYLPSHPERNTISRANAASRCSATTFRN
jgi:hypothetical protein